MAVRSKSGVRLAVTAWLAGGLLLCVAPLSAQDANECDVVGEAPDVVVGDLHEVLRHGTVGDITAFSVGTISCNLGDCWLNWISNTNEHPVIAQNMYRLKDGRFEQLGQSWLKHGFFAVSDSFCESGCLATDGTHLGVNCSDPYSANLNGNQGRLGPRSEVNAFTGDYPYPFTTINQSGDEIYKRLQVNNADLDPALNSGASYFVEGQYVTADDAAAANGTNNSAWRPIDVIESNGEFDILLSGSTIPQQAAIYAWALNDPAASVRPVKVPGEGQFLVGASASSLGGGIWRYEYAVQNLNSDRSAGSFSVPVPQGATVSNLGFHDVGYHSGEPYDGTDWNAIHDLTQNRVIWTTTDHATNPDANALRWGTLYNFRLDVDAAPATGQFEIGLFRPGTPTSVTSDHQVPDACNLDGTCDVGETCGNCAADCGLVGGVESICNDGLDEDCDGLVDCLDVDCCLDALCADGIDADFDGVAECDCDDADGSIWATPSQVDDLQLAEAAGQTTLSWLAPLSPGADTPAYQMLRADSADGFGAATCVLTDPYTATEATDSAVPLSGALFHYLVRAVNDCPGTLGLGSLGLATGPVERVGRTCP